jgi:hypothetical protein
MEIKVRGYGGGCLYADAGEFGIVPVVLASRLRFAFANEPAKIVLDDDRVAREWTGKKQPKLGHKNWYQHMADASHVAVVQNSNGGRAWVHCGLWRIRDFVAPKDGEPGSARLTLAAISA